MAETQSKVRAGVRRVVEYCTPKSLADLIQIGQFLYVWVPIVGGLVVLIYLALGDLGVWRPIWPLLVFILCAYALWAIALVRGFLLKQGAHSQGLSPAVAASLAPPAEPAATFATIDTSNPWREIKGKDHRRVGMRYVTRITFKETVENPKVRLTFFRQDAHLGGVDLSTVAVVSHVYRKTMYKGDPIEITLFERPYDLPMQLICGETPKDNPIKVGEGSVLKVDIECVARDAVVLGSFALFPALSGMPYEEVWKGEITAEIDPHARPEHREIIHT